MHKQLRVMTHILRVAIVGLTIGTAASPAFAQVREVSDVDQRVGPPTTLQKPLAADIAGHTAVVEGAIVNGGQYLDRNANTSILFADQQKDFAYTFDGLFDIRIAKKMANTFTYGFDGRLLVSGLDNNYDSQERFDVYLENYVGRFSYGNFDDRDRIVFSADSVLAGEAELFYDGFFGASNQRAFRFRTRLSSYLIDAAVDEDGKAWNLGVRYGSPNDYVKQFWSLNYQGGDLLGRYRRDGLTAGYLVSYGSLDVAFGLSYDQLDPYRGFATFDRIAGSGGVSYKMGRTTVSAGALTGKTNNGALETAYTAGLRYDYIRGMSMNLGWFYIDSDSTGTDGAQLAAGHLTGVRASVAYRF